MPAPINYTGMQIQPDLAGNLLEGLKLGSGIADMQAQREQQALALQAVQAKLMRQQQYEADADAAIRSNDPRAVASLIARYPEQHEALKASYEGLSAERKDQERRDTLAIGNALRAGRPEAGLAILNRQRQALVNSGQPTDEVDQHIALMQNPTAALQTVTLALSGILPKDQFESWIAAPLAQQNAEAGAIKTKAEADKAVSEAQTAAVTAQNAPRAQAAALDKIAEDIRAS